MKEVEFYLECTRLGYNSDLDLGLLGFSQLALQFIARAMTGKSSPSLPSIQLISSLNKFSEQVTIDHQEFFVIDHYLSLQCAFLNKLYFALPDQHVIDCFAQGIAGQRALLRGCIGPAELLIFASESSQQSRHFVSKVKQHLPMDILQRSFVVCHEFIHFMIRFSETTAADFQRFAVSFSSDEHVSMMYEYGFQNSGTLIETIATKMKDRAFVEECFCDFRAANYLHIFLCNQADLLGDEVFNFQDFVLAIFSFFVNQNFIATIDRMVDVFADNSIESVGRESFQSTEQISVGLNLRRLYLYKALDFIGRDDIGQGTSEDLERWRATLQFWMKRIDDVAMNTLQPTINENISTPLFKAFGAKLHSGQTMFPMANIRLGSKNSLDELSAQLDIAKAIVSVDPSTFESFLFADMKTKVMEWRHHSPNDPV